MKITSQLRHVTEQPFVLATGAAALIHTTWSLGTLFSGVQPNADVQSVHFWGWLVPALLMAFALDIGQIATSSEIREHGLSWSRSITFIAFALATYYFQWFYMLHHMPDLPLAAGVTGKDWSGFALWLRDAGIWIAPAMLPLSTILYTFSSKRTELARAPIVETKTIVTYPVIEQPVKSEVKELPTAPLSQLPTLEMVTNHNGNGNHANHAAGGAKKNSRKAHGATDDSATNDVDPPIE